jgi:DNA-binding NarL/FixJ family response regulator
MNTETIIALSAAGISLAGSLAAIFSYRQYRICRGLLEFTERQIDELDTSAGALNETVEGYKKKTADQSRRIAWLESRLRQPKLQTDEVIDDTLTPKQPVKWNMTERRHHVLKLASRGQSYDSIAATLGMMPGEVELIINLNRASYSSFAQA